MRGKRWVIARIGAVLSWAGFLLASFVVSLPAWAAEFPQKPIYVTFTGEKKHMDAGKAFLEPKGVPTFPLIEEPFDVLSILTQCRKEMQKRK